MDTVSILSYTKITLYIIPMLMGIIYVLPNILIKRLRNPLNLLTVNIALGIIVCMLFWIVYTFMFVYDIETLYSEARCNLLFCSLLACSVAPSLATILVSMNRYFTIIYSARPFFKRIKWVGISIIIQWIACIIVAIPIMPTRLPVRINWLFDS